MNKGFAMLEVLLATLVISLSIQLILVAIVKFPMRQTIILDSPWNKLAKGCDYQCVLDPDLP